MLAAPLPPRQIQLASPVLALHLRFAAKPLARITIATHGRSGANFGRRWVLPARPRASWTAAPPTTPRYDDAVTTGPRSAPGPTGPPVRPPSGRLPRPTHLAPACSVHRRPAGLAHPASSATGPLTLNQWTAGECAAGLGGRTDPPCGDGDQAASSGIRATRTAMSSAGSVTRRLMRAEAYVGPKGTAFPAAMARASLSMPASMGASRDSIRPSV